MPKTTIKKKPITKAYIPYEKLLKSMKDFMKETILESRGKKEW